MRHLSLPAGPLITSCYMDSSNSTNFRRFPANRINQGITLIRNWFSTKKPKMFSWYFKVHFSRKLHWYSLLDFFQKYTLLLILNILNMPFCICAVFNCGCWVDLLINYHTKSDTILLLIVERIWNDKYSFQSPTTNNSKKWLMALLEEISVLQKERFVSLQKGVSDQCVKFKLM